MAVRGSDMECLVLVFDLRHPLLCSIKATGDRVEFVHAAVCVGVDAARDRAAGFAWDLATRCRSGDAVPVG